MYCFSSLQFIYSIKGVIPSSIVCLVLHPPHVALNFEDLPSQPRLYWTLNFNQKEYCYKRECRNARITEALREFNTTIKHQDKVMNYLGYVYFREVLGHILPRNYFNPPCSILSFQLGSSRLWVLLIITIHISSTEVCSAFFGAYLFELPPKVQKVSGICLMARQCHPY